MLILAFLKVELKGKNTTSKERDIVHIVQADETKEEKDKYPTTKHDRTSEIICQIIESAKNRYGNQKKENGYNDW